MARQTEVILIDGDMHCGHYTGLTPPDWWWPEKSDIPWRQKIATYQRWAWKTYCSYLKEMGPFTKHINLGDCIDGKGLKSGGTELLTSDRTEQCDMAGVCIKKSGVKDIVITKGTTYHAGASEDWEEQVANDCGAKIGCHEYITTNGVTISARHFVGGTQNPKSKATSILGEQVNNDQWAREYTDHPRANIFLRGHVHRNVVIDEPKTLSIICPGLQGWTKFGAKICGLFVHFGIIVIEITPAGSRSWRRMTAELGKQVHVTKW